MGIRPGYPIRPAICLYHLSFLESALAKRDCDERLLINQCGIVGKRIKLLEKWQEKREFALAEHGRVRDIEQPP